MEQYVVPQFIDVESKIVGPITPRQFIVVVIWGLFSFIGYKLFDIVSFILFFLFWTVLCGMIGFYKVNGRPFYIFILILIQGKKKPFVRVWRKDAGQQIFSEQSRADADKPSAAPRPSLKRLSGSRLSELSLIVDTGGAYQGDFFSEEKEKEE